MTINKDIDILIVDDDVMVADNLTDYLSRLGYRTFAVYDSNEAVEKFREGNFQLVITDLIMPDMDGIELIDRIKRIDKKAMVIVVTGHGTIESAVTAIRKGAYDYILKPFKLEELEVIITRALERQTLSKQLGLFRGIALALMISIPVWLILGIILAYVLK